MDILKDLIDQYQKDIIPLERLQDELNFQLWREEANQGKKNTLLLSKIKSRAYNDSIGKNIEILTPEEVLLEKERMSEILQMLKQVREIIGDRNFEILCMYVVENKKQKHIAKYFKIAQPRVATILSNICRKVKECKEKFPQYETILCKDNLLPEQSTLEAEPPETKGYPFEFLQRISLDGKWQKSVKRVYIMDKCVAKFDVENFVSQETCLLPIYFEKAFGDDKTICNICDKCKIVK